MQTEPVREPVQVEEGVRSLGIKTVILSRVGSGAKIEKGLVMVMVSVGAAERRTS